MSKEKIFTAELNDAAWTGTITFRHLDKQYCVAEIRARDTLFLVVITCYYEGYGAREYCISVPSRDFGCRISSKSLEWNGERFRKYIRNKVNRRSLTCAVETILKEMEEMQN